MDTDETVDAGRALLETWQQEDCYCCAGLQWGGEEPRTCRRCQGLGFVWRHIKSGTLALWPGGPFCGRAVIDATLTDGNS